MRARCCSFVRTTPWSKASADRDPVFSFTFHLAIATAGIWLSAAGIGALGRLYDAVATYQASRESTAPLRYRAPSPLAFPENEQPQSQPAGNYEVAVVLTEADSNSALEFCAELQRVMSSHPDVDAHVALRLLGSEAAARSCAGENFGSAFVTYPNQTMENLNGARWIVWFASTGRVLYSSRQLPVAGDFRSVVDLFMVPGTGRSE
jgi:hypothetical protein